MRLPYDSIHRLEDQYGSLSLVPDDNKILRKIQKQFANLFNTKSVQKLKAKQKVKYDELMENKIIKLINLGYAPYEIQKILKVGFYRVMKALNKYGLEPKPKFEFVAINLNTGDLIYAESYRLYRTLINQPVYKYEQAQQVMEFAGYKLKKAKKAIRWSKLKTGDQYIDRNKKLCTKN